MPKVSIVVPVYNVEKYLHECMDSILNQTLRDIEIIAVDDGSKDNSGKILDEYAAKDFRVKVIHKQNSGYGHSMNVGIEKATGDYIGIVEPDDYILPKMYETLYTKAEENDVDFIKSDCYKFRSHGEGIIKKYTKLDESGLYYNKVINPKEDLKPFTFFMNNWSGIYKRSFLEKYKIKHNETPGASFQDTGFWFQAFTRASKIYFVDEAFYMYRQDNSASSINNKEKLYAIKEENDFIQKYLESNPELEKRFGGIFYYKKYLTYVFNLKRVANDLKQEFLMNCFYPEFVQAAKENKIDYSLFKKREVVRLKLLLESPQKFYSKIAGVPTFFERIFSIKNKEVENTKYKILTILGVEIILKQEVRF